MTPIPGRNDHPGDLLSALLDGELDAPTADATRRHLDSCVMCSEELDGIRKVRAALSRLTELEAPPWFFARRFAALRRAAKWAPVAAVAAGLVAAVALGLRDSPSRLTPDQRFVDAHVVVHGDDPIADLAPAAVPVNFER